MSQFRNNNLNRKIESLQEEISQTSSLWDRDNSEQEQKDIRRMKQKWKNQQYQKFNQVQKKRRENKSIKRVILILIGIGSIPLMLTATANIWQRVSVEMADESSTTTENKPELGNSNNLIEKVKELKKITSKEDKLVQTSNCNSSDGVDECEIIDDQKTVADQLIKTLEVIDSRNQKLDKAIQLSDGENVSLENEK